MTRYKILVFFLVLSCLSVLFVPIFTFTYLYPSVDKLLISNTEEYAKMVANHFTMYFHVPEKALSYNDVSHELKEEIFEVLDNFSLEKVKLFSSTGEVLFSTSPEDIGQMNTKDYFKLLVLRGHKFTKLVRKDTETLEGRKVSIDVIETYVPIFGKDNVVGAFEIYYDITQLKGMLGKLVHRTSMIIFTVSAILLISLVFSLVKLSRNMAARDEAEKQLSNHRDELEMLVGKRTSELTNANKLLQEDIKKRLDTENALQVSEQQFRSLVELAGDAIFLADADTGIITDVNRKGTELVGRNAEDLIGRHLSCLHPTDDEEMYSSLIESNYSLQLPFNKIVFVQHISGRKIPVDISATTIEFDRGRIVQGIFRDISQRLQFEDELQKTEKFKTASILAGGIAHDFNNLLTAVLSNLTLAKLEAEPHEKIKARLAETERAVGRARDLTQQLLAFAKGGPPSKKVVNINKLIDDSARFVLHGSKVKCDCSIPENLWQVEVDEGQISQVVNNLVINASHAMDDGGICTIRAENIVLDKSCGLPLPAGKYIKISVADKGRGIPEEHLGRIFDPFFTTKKQGSGLGLSSSFTILKNHGGHIDVASKVGEGTTFSIYLPASELAPVAIAPPAQVDLEGHGKILVMDDEEIVREAVTSLLQYLGYDVDTARDGQEAIEKYTFARELGLPYDVVIMDLTVPGGIGGKEAVREIRAIDPSVKAIVSSGYYTDPVLANFRDYGFDGVVPKPYQVEELGRVVKEVMAGRA